MSKITPPVIKFAHALRRSISSSAQAGHPSALLDSQARASRELPRNLKDLRRECQNRGISRKGNKADLVARLAAQDMVGVKPFHTTSSHRPVPTQVSNSSYRIIPMMQGFKSSAPQCAVRDNSTMDFFFFPEIGAAPPLNPYEKLRVPLLPDNYNPDRSPGSINALETPDTALPKPEISIMAAHPEQVVPAAMSEVVGNEGVDMSLDSLTEGFTTKIQELKEPGVWKELWEGIMDDLFGPKKPTTRAA